MLLFIIKSFGDKGNIALYHQSARLRPHPIRVDVHGTTNFQVLFEKGGGKLNQLVQHFEPVVAAGGGKFCLGS